MLFFWLPRHLQPKKCRRRAAREPSRFEALHLRRILIRVGFALAELEAVLRMIYTPDTEIVKKATKIVQAFAKKPDSVQALMQQLMASEHTEGNAVSIAVLEPFAV